jgi:hypothetical protein
MPSSIAAVLRVGYTDCVADQIVALPFFTSATAHDVPIDPCIWYACRYVALITLGAFASVSSTSFELTTKLSRDAFWSRRY